MQSKRKLVVGTVFLAIVVAVVACGKKSPKVTIDQADRGAFSALRAFQIAETAAHNAKAPWPSDALHAQIKTKLSSSYSLVVDVANIGINLQPGQPLPAQAVGEINELTQTANDIVALVDPSAAPDIQTKIAAVKATVSALIAIVKGVTQ